MAGGRYCSDGLLPGSSQLELAIWLTLHWCCCGDQPDLSQRFDGRHQPGGRHVEALRQSCPSNRGLLLETEQEPGRERIELNASAGCEPTVELVQAVTAGQHVKCPLDLLLGSASGWHGEGMAHVGRLGGGAQSHLR